MGGVIDGMPAGVSIDMDRLQRFVNRRRPGQTAGASARDEKDKVEILSGLWQGKTLGTPIGFVVRNTDARSADYEGIAACYRPNHADFTWEAKYGIRDPRGGGRASARETVARVVAGGIALQALQSLGERAFGGVISCKVCNVPVGLGEPAYGKLHAQLAAAMMSIPSVHGFEYGDGFGMASCRGSEVMDVFEKRADGTVGTSANHSGGIQGGISNGEDITMRIAFKPVPTLMRDVPTIDRDGNPVTLAARGRHDVCVINRALPVVESMAALVILDNYLIRKTNVL